MYNLSRKIKKTIILITLDILIIGYICIVSSYLLQPKVIYITNEAQASTLPSAELVKAGSDAGNSDVPSLRSTEVESSNISTPRSDVQETIRRVAKEENFDNVDGLLRLALCESSFNSKSVHPNKDTRKTTDYGLFQINDYWHSEISKKDALNAEFATRWTINRIKQGYLYEWNCNGVYNNLNYKI